MSLAHSAKGKVIQSNGQSVVFAPANTTYELHLAPGKGYSGPVGTPVNVVIQGKARKVYTVPSGGLFVSPITGTPKILQGRVKDITDTSITLNCGVLVNVELPREPGSVELARGPIEVGSLVNVVLLPGAACEVAA